VRMRILGGAEAARAALAARSDVHDVHIDGLQAEFLHDGSEDTEAELLRELVNAGLRIVAFGSRAQSLEDVFMQVTEGLVQ
jgi:hypothetical protein